MSSVYPVFEFTQELATSLLVQWGIASIAKVTPINWKNKTYFIAISFPGASNDSAYEIICDSKLWTRGSPILEKALGHKFDVENLKEVQSRIKKSADDRIYEMRLCSHVCDKDGCIRGTGCFYPHGFWVDVLNGYSFIVPTTNAMELVKAGNGVAMHRSILSNKALFVLKMWHIHMNTAPKTSTKAEVPKKAPKTVKVKNAPKLEEEVAASVSAETKKETPTDTKKETPTDTPKLTLSRADMSDVDTDEEIEIKPEKETNDLEKENMVKRIADLENQVEKMKKQMDGMIQGFGNLLKVMGQPVV